MLDAVGHTYGCRMVRFLSAEWLAALDDSARELRVPDDVDLVVDQVVTAPDGSETAYHLVFAGGGLRVRPGRAETASVAVQQSYETAVALATGALNAQQAMAQGQLRVAGDVALLSRHGRSLGRLPDVFAGLRERTEFCGPPAGRAAPRKPGRLERRPGRWLDGGKSGWLES